MLLRPVLGWPVSGATAEKTAKPAERWNHALSKPLPSDKMGPFIRLSNRDILTVHDTKGIARQERVPLIDVDQTFREYARKNGSWTTCFLMECIRISRGIELSPTY